MSLRTDIQQVFEPGRQRTRRPSAARLTASQDKGWGRNRRMPPYIWRDGLQYFSIRWLAESWSVPRGVVRRWALARPHLTYLWSGPYLFCRNEGTPPRPRGNPCVPPSVERDGVLYYSMPALARRRRMKPHSTRAWVKRHPHLALRVGKHNYCRDEEFGGPRRTPPCIEREGLTYWNIPELGRRHGMSERAARRWAAKHPHLTVREGSHLYARDEEYDPGSRAPAAIQRDGFDYYSVRELASRRGVSPETTRAWAARRPHLVRREGKYIFVRDEDYHPRRRPIPSAPEPPIWLRTIASRRARTHAP